MQFLGIGDYCDLGALYLRLIEEGHEVRFRSAIRSAVARWPGLVERTADWRGELDWIRAAGRDGIILFENVAMNRGALQDELRGEGFNVIGGSAYGDRLENDRAYAQRVLAGCRAWRSRATGNLPIELRRSTFCRRILPATS